MKTIGLVFASKASSFSLSFLPSFISISLLFSWLPIIGDPITFVAGILKYDFKKFLVLVFIAKLSRYLVIAYLVV